ncbi:MAG: hypothetical protein EHM39_14455 [Chloroflexi bacterium]|nr:MAG: hypothetical protein EHM39_14455 [Chloroflexota bacterium]
MRLCWRSAADWPCQLAAQFDDLLEQRQMREVFGSPDEFLAGEDALQREDGYLGLQPFDLSGPPILVGEAVQPVHFVDEA